MINDDMAPLVLATKSQDVSVILISNIPNLSSENSNSSFAMPRADVKIKT